MQIGRAVDFIVLTRPFNLEPTGENVNQKSLPSCSPPIHCHLKIKDGAGGHSRDLICISLMSVSKRDRLVIATRSSSPILLSMDEWVIYKRMNILALPRNYNSPSGFLLYISLFFFFFFKILIFGSMWQLTGRWQYPSSNCLTVTTRFNDQLFDLELATALNGQHFLFTLFFMTSFNLPTQKKGEKEEVEEKKTRGKEANAQNPMK